jgi:hypothetical protein
MRRYHPAGRPHMSGPDGPEQRAVDIDDRFERDWLRLFFAEQRADESRDALPVQEEPK